MIFEEEEEELLNSVSIAIKLELAGSFVFFGGDAVDRHHEDPHSSAAIAKQDFLVHKVDGLLKVTSTDKAAEL